MCLIRRSRQRVRASATLAPGESVTRFRVIQSRTNSNTDLLRLSSSVSPRVYPTAKIKITNSKGRSAPNDLLFSAVFVAFVVLLYADSAGAIPFLAPLSALLVALLFALAAVRRSPLLRLAGLFLGSLYTIGGVLTSLAKAF